MKILITGGAGYVGNKLTERLLDGGFKVTILDNFMYGFDSILHLVNHKNITIIKQDIRNDFPTHEYDVVYHLAALSGLAACEANRSSAYQINVEATDKLCKFLSSGQVLIYASTTSFYGQGDECTEDTTIDPVSYYGKTKYEAEQICMQRQNSIALRFATIFGVSTKQRNDLMINDFVYQAIKNKVIVLFDGDAKRTFLHINDAVDCYYESYMNYEKLVGKIYNVGHECFNLSKLEIGQQIQKHVDFKIIESDIKDKDLRNFVISFKKIQQDIRWFPFVSLDDGITELIKLYEFYDYVSHFKTI
jgi:nucleoside-diphosphate-sugar epimerase